MSFEVIRDNLNNLINILLPQYLTNLCHLYSGHIPYRILVANKYFSPNISVPPPDYLKKHLVIRPIMLGVVLIKLHLFHVSRSLVSSNDIVHHMCVVCDYRCQIFVCIRIAA